MTIWGVHKLLYQTPPDSQILPIIFSGQKTTNVMQCMALLCLDFRQYVCYINTYTFRAAKDIKFKFAEQLLFNNQELLS